MTGRSSGRNSTFVEALSDEDEQPWVEKFCRKRGNEYLNEVTEEFLLDRFNLTHIGLDLPRFQQAYDLITDNYNGDVNENGETVVDLQSAAKQLYGAIHQRFIQTPPGLAQIHKKYTTGVFGMCPRVLCEGQALLPVGLSDKFGVDTVKLYCMRCEDLYLPKSSAHNAIDGAYFGTSLPQLFILSNKIVLPSYEERVVKYVPRIFGFRIADPETVEMIDGKEAARLNGAAPSNNS